MSSESEIEKIQQAIQALEAQRHSLGEAMGGKTGLLRVGGHG